MSINSTVTQMQNNTNAVQFQQGRANLGTGKMSREGFMQLMLAQLQYQDPMEPQDNTQMLTQQLQLEQADQMKDLTDSNTFASAASMVGKQAWLPDAPWDFDNATSGTPEWDVATNSPKVAQGEITAVQFDRVHGKALVLINGKYYDAASIKQLAPAQPTASSGSSTGGT